MTNSTNEESESACCFNLCQVRVCMCFNLCHSLPLSCDSEPSGKINQEIKIQNMCSSFLSFKFVSSAQVYDVVSARSLIISAAIGVSSVTTVTTISTVAAATGIIVVIPATIIVPVPSASRRGATGPVAITRGAARARAGPAAAVARAAGAVPVIVATTTVVVPVVTITSPTVPVVVVPVPSSAATIIIPFLAVSAATTSTIATATATVSSVPTTTVASLSAFTHTAGNILNGDNALVELTAIRGLFGQFGLLGARILDEGVVALHINTNKLAKRLKEHLEIFALGGFLVKVNNEESL